VVHNILEVLVGLLLGILPLVVAVHLTTYFLVQGTGDVFPVLLVACVSTADVLAHLNVIAEEKGLLQRVQSLLLLRVVVKSFPAELMSGLSIIIVDLVR
jgi:hypothetical protein